MTLTDVLASNGILRPDITIRAAQDAGLELAAACVVLMKETSGGRMVYGSDGKPAARRTDAQGQVIYEFGGPVTPANYLRYRAAQKAGLIPRQGIGDCQLTSEDYVASAEAIGGPTGPADPYSNQRAGFAGLAALMKRYGDRNGFVAYNGGPGAIGQPATHPAQVYGDNAVAQLATWRSRLTAAPAPVPAPAPSPAPATSSEDDVSVQNFLLTGSGEITPRIPVGKGAIATSRAWISANLRSGATQSGRVRWWYQGADAGIGRRDWTTLTVKDGLPLEITDEIPAGTRKVNIQYEFPEGGTICIEAIR